MARRRTHITATVLDEDGYPFIIFKGNPQDVADACVIYVTNISNPLGGLPLIDVSRERNEEEP